jgi:hypothetical protein
MMKMMISENVMRMMNNFGAEVSSKTITMCAEKYGFSAEEALRELGGVSVSQKPKEIKERKDKPKKPSIALPFNGEFKPNLCHALRQNSGLYTQCQSGPTKGAFCNNCHKLAEKAEDGIPEYGLIQQRMEAYSNGSEYVDPKGRKPVAYLKVMKKYKLTKEQVLEEAGKFGIEINPVHFEAPVDARRGRPAAKPKEPKEANAVKGRPKKEKKVIIAEDDDADLFASLVASANADNEDDENGIIMPKKSAEEKEAERLAKEEEKAAKLAAIAAEKQVKTEKLAAEKAEKEAKLAAEKQAKTEKLAAEKLEKEAKLAALAAEKQAKTEKLAAEKQAKAEKLAAEKLEKEAKLAAEKQAKVEKLAAEKEAKLAAKKKPADEDDEPEVVKKITFEDKKYLLSKKSGVIYDYEKYANEGEQVVVGKWNEESKKIIFDKAEESADEYESESDADE